MEIEASNRFRWGFCFYFYKEKNLWSKLIHHNANLGSFGMCCGKAQMGCQNGASGHVCWGLSSHIGWLEQLVMLVPCADPSYSHLAAPQAMQKAKTLAKLRLLHHTLNYEDITSQQSLFSDHLRNKIASLTKKRKISFANNGNEFWDFQFLQIKKIHSNWT